MSAHTCIIDDLCFKNDYDFLWMSSRQCRNGIPKEYRMNTEWSNRQEGQYR